MGKLDDFIEKRGRLVMNIFLLIQTSMFIAYGIMFCINNQDAKIESNVFVITSLLVFLIFMIHFAHHSVKNY